MLRFFPYRRVDITLSLTGVPALQAMPVILLPRTESVSSTFIKLLYHSPPLPSACTSVVVAAASAGDIGGGAAGGGGASAIPDVAFAPLDYVGRPLQQQARSQ